MKKYNITIFHNNTTKFMIRDFNEVTKEIKIKDIFMPLCVNMNPDPKLLWNKKGQMYLSFHDFQTLKLGEN